ncbi:hypothetical protein LEP1GSC116_1458 [Leptospira interrogans serovar Icterohaemorrhagiae str. Verdun HP]|uniref:Uncharacterized protein n=3 Tax=Leptospira interrogans TaxID=173 RepID=M6ZPK4_LEPIR|nr:hypothetical protein LEP1GSC148_0325 [Leptospira interrogans serovar Canicola str. LT1962]EMG20692.1 hypothetical protein LEP1GSC150_1073 [Leptospira interrogans serovar Copenhageni str. LT2050]EMO02406.1 hypothetical protein LEP1GSC116_1458 [Leptospira interrogans serovar Icterohaemorrhagiae str. Verdun HP]EMP07996.1 hypothetical protein LEP1GSC124_3244 [Leptospira interrogans serovar Pyrogenes str. 200701872]
MVETGRFRNHQPGLYIHDQKNQSSNSIEIIYNDLNHIKSLPFRSPTERDKAYEAILENLSRMKLFFE